MDLNLYIQRLSKDKKFKDIEAAFLGYLAHHPKSARLQSWMFGALANAIKINRAEAIQPADTARIKEALGKSAILAQEDGNPNFILTAADQMLTFGYDEVTANAGGKPVRVAVGPLLDEVARKVPHRAEPLLLSLNLARRTLDPKRMADAAERLLALGWPGLDDQIRAEVSRQVDELAGDLQEKARQGEADDLQARLATALGRDLFIRLTWEGDADLDLHVGEPLGVTASHFLPRTVFGGAIVKEGRGKAREEVYVCPRAFDGDYTIHVESVYQDPAKPPVAAAKLEIITREGLPGEHKEIRVVQLQAAKSVVVRGKDGKTETLPSATPPKSPPVVIHLTGGRRKVVLPFNGSAAQPPAIVVMPPEVTPEEKARLARAKAEARAQAEDRFRARQSGQSSPDRASPGSTRPGRTVTIP